MIYLKLKFANRKDISYLAFCIKLILKKLTFTIMSFRTRRGTRSSRARPEVPPECVPICPPTASQQCGCCACCVPLECIPLCPTCDDQKLPAIKLAKKLLKCCGTVVIIAILAAYLSSSYQGEYVDDSMETEDINRSLGKSGDKEMISFEMKFNNLVNEMRELKERVNEIRMDKSGGLSDQATDQIYRMISDRIQMYDSDKTGWPDFALENLGGCILSTRNTTKYSDGTAHLSFLGFPIMSFVTDPRAIIQATTTPGECWAFGGERGTAVIQLITSVIITHVSLEHISAKLSPTGDISSAPKQFTLKGLAFIDDKNPHDYGTFTYSSDGPTIQTFTVQKPTPKAFKIIEFTVLTNQGNKDFTCIYRVRIHGKPALIEAKKDQ